MGKVILVAGNKGGVGKSTTSIQIAGGLTNKGHSVIVVDTDTGTGEGDIGRRSCHMILNMRTAYEDQVPFIQSMMSSPDSSLTRTLKDLKEKYDFVIVDTPGFATKAFTSTAAVANKVVLLTETTKVSYPSLLPIARALKQIEDNFSAQFDIDKKIDTLLVMSRVDTTKKPNTDKLKKFYAKNLMAQMSFSSNLLKSLNSVSNSTDEGLTVYDHKSFSNAKGMYDCFIDEILGLRNPRWVRGQEPDKSLLALIENEDIDE